tara:strand:- start:3798 stop:3977 length:180 start_codon:yes stop_codon:yes gene_type:complete
MKKVMILIGCVAMLAGCTRYVKGTKLDISIKRTPVCKVSVKVDGALILDAVAKKPCKKE